MSKPKKTDNPTSNFCPCYDITYNDKPEPEVSLTEGYKSLVPDLGVDIQLLLARLSISGLAPNLLSNAELELVNAASMYFTEYSDTLNRRIIVPNVFNRRVISFLNVYVREKENWPDPFYPGLPPKPYIEEVGYCLLKSKDDGCIYLYRYNPSYKDYPYYNMTDEGRSDIKHIGEVFVYGDKLSNAMVERVKNLKAEYDD